MILKACQPKFIFCLQVRESCSLYIRIYIFCVVVSYELCVCEEDCTQSYWIKIIFKQIYLTRSSKRVLPLWVDANEGVLHTSQILKSGPSPPDAILCHIQDTKYFSVVGKCTNLLLCKRIKKPKTALYIPHRHK